MMTSVHTHAASRLSSRPVASSLYFGKADTLIKIEEVPVMIGIRAEYQPGTQWPAQELLARAQENQRDFQEIVSKGWARISEGNPKAEHSKEILRCWDKFRGIAESLAQRSQAAVSYLRHMVSSPDDTLNPEIVLEPDTMAEGHSLKNLQAGKFYAKGADGVPADPEMALRFFNQAMADPDPEDAGFSKLQVANVLIRGYCSVAKNPRQALTILNGLIQETTISSTEGAFFLAEAARMKLRDLADLLTSSEKRQTIAVLKKAVTAEGATADLVASTVRFFATVLSDPKQAKALAVLASQKFYDWNQRSDRGQPAGSSKGISGASELMALAKDFATGEKGLPQDKDLAKSLLEAFLAELKTKFPVYEMDSAKIFAQNLDSPDRAADWVNVVLHNTGDPSLLLQAAELLAKELKQPQQAEQILNALSEQDLAASGAGKKEPLRQENYIQMARIYAESLNRPDLAEWRLNMALTYEFSGTHSQVENMIEIAKVYKTLGQPERSAWVLDLVAPLLPTELAQKSRLAMAEAYASILGSTSAAMSCLAQVVEHAPEVYNAAHCLKRAQAILETLDQKHPGLSELRQQMKAAREEIQRTNPLFYASED